MQLKEYGAVSPTRFDNDQAKGIAARVVIGKNEGGNNFYMRVFEISPGGHTPLHTHDWEHEMFVHAGRGEVFGNGQWQAVQPGNVVFIPANELHQMRNRGEELFVVVCLVPGHAPEL
jgi:quercetin dioxygenase-like cupin family protein